MNISINYGYYVQGKLIPFSIEITSDEKYYNELKKLLRVDRITGYMFKRAGKSNDGGYIMTDDFYSGDNIAYSFGISNDVSWDDFMADNEYEVFMYDPTINKLPKNRNAFHYFKEGLSGEYNPATKMNTLENFISINNHKKYKNMILKIDIEGSEWNFLETVKSSTLNQFDQILFEFHDLIKGGTDKELEKRLSGLKKLNKTHQLIHLHGNNSGYYIYADGALYPNVMEATYVKKSKYDTYKDNVFLPTNIDEPCDPGRPDLVLGYWNAE